MKQVFYPYTELEEHDAGMWRTTSVEERDGLVDAAADLMRNPIAFRDAMLRAVKEWPKSMLAAMSTPSLNQRAWMGHAGCCIEVGTPEDLTRLAWHSLTTQEQVEANAAADVAVSVWHQSRLDPQEGLWRHA